MIDKGWLTVGGIGRRAIDTFLRLGFAARFLGLTLRNSGVCLRRPRLVVREVYFSGVLSLVIILVSGLFVGMVLGLQGYQTLRTYGSESALGVLVALSLLRELGPVITALLFASRAGSAVTAEIGLMKATEQLRAMEMMAVDPIARVVAPRFWAGVISTPLLTATSPSRHRRPRLRRVCAATRESWRAAVLPAAQPDRPVRAGPGIVSQPPP